MTATLIFPFTVPAAQRYAEEAAERGEAVVAAASVPIDAEGAPDVRVLLPTIYAPEFLGALRQVIADNKIVRVVAPVASVHAHLARLRQRGELGIQLIGQMPIIAHARSHEALMRLAAVYHPFIQEIAEGASDLRLIEVAAIFRQALSIYGESGEDKLAAMMAVFADAPKGDVVEIGTLVGRTAYVLAHLSRRHGTGSVLVVDPWSPAEAVQTESPEGIRDLSESWPWGLSFESFLTALLPLTGGVDFAYIAGRSVEGHARWAAEAAVETPEFGRAGYCGRIAVLHIDGNHDRAAVAEDCRLWVPHLAPGGWLILDDYVWLHGDGPRLVGDALVGDLHQRIGRAFVCGKALFVKLLSPSSKYGQVGGQETVGVDDVERVGKGPLE